MTGQVDVLVRVLERPGLTREATVQVREEAFRSPNWRALAALFAANALELPFTFVAERARYGLRPEDRDKLREIYSKASRVVEGIGPYGEDGERREDDGAGN